MIVRRSLLCWLGLAPAVSLGGTLPLMPGERIVKRIKSVRRVSVENGDSGYETYRMLLGAEKNVRVFLDGNEIDRCITADADEGFIKACLGEHEIKGGSWPIVILRGNVEIKIEDAEKSA